MKLNSLNDVLIHELQDLHSAEQQLVQALPKMVSAAKSRALQKALQEHLEQTESQLARIEEVLSTVEAKPGKTKCVGMAGIIKEGSEVMSEDGEPAAKDAALISAAQRVEHYEMAGYGTATAMAKLLGLDDIASTLEEILEEERAADAKLSQIAKEVNSAADEGAGSNARGKRSKA